MDIGKNFFLQMVIRDRNRLPRDMMESPCLEVFKRNVDMALEDKV